MGWSELLDLIPHRGATHGEIAVRLLRALLAATDDERDLLEKIDRKLDALLRGPYFTGVEYLREAADESRPIGRRKDSAELARQEFMRAWGQLKDDSAYRATVEFNLAVVWLALGSAEDAKTWATRSLGSSRSLIRELNDTRPKSKTGSVLRYATFAVTLPLPFLGLLGERATTAVTGRRVQNEIAAVSPLEHAARVLCIRLSADMTDYPECKEDFWIWCNIASPRETLDSHETRIVWISEANFRRLASNPSNAEDCVYGWL